MRTLTLVKKILSKTAQHIMIRLFKIHLVVNTHLHKKKIREKYDLRTPRLKLKSESNET